jgi:hypothetical protein
MNKKIVYLLAFVCWSGLATLAMAVEIPNPLGNTSTFSQLLTQIAQAAGKIVASLGGLMFIISGILFLTSAGNPQKMETAKKAFMYAVAGIVIGLAADAIVAEIKKIIGVP